MVAISFELEKVIMQAVEFKQENRPSSAKEFIEKLPGQVKTTADAPKAEAYKEPQQKTVETIKMPVAKATRNKRNMIIWVTTAFVVLLFFIGVGNGINYFGNYEKEQTVHESEIEALAIEDKAFISNDGEIKYDGEFKGGKWLGLGEEYWEDSSKWRNIELWYEGELEDGEPHGYGILYDKDGIKVYVGEWIDGEAHGRGALYYSDGTKQYEGEWKDSKWQGQGIEYLEDGTKKYEGEWKDGLRQGQGMEYLEDGAWYLGEFKFGKWHGQGILYNADGTSYVGEWRFGEPVR